MPYIVQIECAENWKSALCDATKHSQFHADKQAALFELQSKHVKEAKTLRSERLIRQINGSGEDFFFLFFFGRGHNYFSEAAALMS